MRWAVLLAAGCFICVSQPGHANKIALRLSKPNGTWSEYLNDVAACNPYRPYTPAERGDDHHRMTEAETIALSARYFGCMRSMGYRADPNGYRAAGYVRIGDTDILVPQLQ